MLVFFALQIDKQTSLLTHFANTRSCARKDSHVQPPDVDCVDGVQSLTDVGRSQVISMSCRLIRK